MSIVQQCTDFISLNRIKIPIITIQIYLAAIFYTKWLRINDHGRASCTLRAKDETQCSGMTRPKGKSRGGPTRSPRGKFPIYSSSLPNTWEPIKRMNGIVAAAAMLRAALGVHEIRAHRSLSLSPFSPHLSLSVFLSVPPFGLSLFLPALQLRLSRSIPPFRLSPNALFTPSLPSWLFANRNSSLQGGQRYYHEFT